MNTIQRLTDKLADYMDDKELRRTVRKLKAIGTHDAAAAIATVLDTPAETGRILVKTLVSMGPVVIPAMLEVIDTGVEEEGIRNAHRVLARLGNVHSARAQYAVCWADLEEQEPLALDRTTAA